MRSPPLCARLGLFLMLLALAANLLTPTGAARRLPRPDASLFPRVIGEWQGGVDLPIPELTRQSLPTATLIDRIYANAQGDAIELTLVSAERAEDAHDPEACLPGWGWTLENAHSLTLDGQAMRSATAHQNGQALHALFWWDTPDAPASRWLSQLQRFRIETQGRGTILVRLTTPATPHSEATLNAFARQLLPALSAWKQAEARKEAEKTREGTGNREQQERIHPYPTPDT